MCVCVYVCVYVNGLIVDCRSPPHTPSVYLAIRVDDHVLCFKNIHLHYITPIKIVLHLPDF